MNQTAMVPNLVATVAVIGVAVAIELRAGGLDRSSLAVGLSVAPAPP